MTNFNTILDSRDIIDRIEELENEETIPVEDQDEYNTLKQIEEEFSVYGEWDYGATIIPEDQFVDYITDLIDDCYDLPTQDGWPYNRLEMDYEAAADDAKVDYCEVHTNEGTYLMPAC